MTNKKLKMAAMSVALTACVAASPLAAKADAPFQNHAVCFKGITGHRS